MRRVWPIIAVFVIAETVLAAVNGGYTTATQRCLLAVYVTQFLSFLYMVLCIARLNWRGRKYENVQGQFVTSPIYQRLMRIMYGIALVVDVIVEVVNGTNVKCVYIFDAGPSTRSSRCNSKPHRSCCTPCRTRSSNSWTS